MAALCLEEGGMCDGVSALDPLSPITHNPELLLQRHCVRSQSEKGSISRRTNWSSAQYLTHADMSVVQALL